MKKISCIVCAYNEGARIGSVLEVLSKHDLIDEILVVDDCSSDNTSLVARDFAKVKLITLEKNSGKSHAFGVGLEQASGDLILMVDADLINLLSENITRILQPVVGGDTDVSFSLRKNSISIYTFLGVDFFVQKILRLDILSGERVLPKNILVPYIEEIKKISGYALETFLNKILIKNKLSIAVVRWSNVTNPTKQAKNGFWKGLLKEIYMLKQIGTNVSAFESLMQNYRLFSLVKIRK